MTQAKTFRGYLNGCISKCAKSKNTELEFLFRELLEKFNEFYPTQIVKNEIQIVTGWKGKGTTEIYRGFQEDFRIVEYIKDKETLEVKKTYHTVTKQDLNRVLNIVKQIEINVPHKCYYFAKKLGYEWKELWKERRIYFQIYYFPVKTLEALGLIKYSGRGTITRLI